MKAGSRPVEGYFEDVAKFLAMAPRILFLCLTELNISEEKNYIDCFLYGEYHDILHNL